MGKSSLLAVAGVLGIAAFANDGVAQSPPDSPQVCATEGAETFMCGISRPEDLFAIPNTNWIVSSALGGGLHLIDASRKTSTQIYPSPTARERFERTSYPTCEGAPDAAEQKSFTTLGVVMRIGTAGVHTLYATRFPTVSRVQVFELDLNAAQPFVTWIGCVDAPADTILLNSVAPLPDGGFVATHFYERGPNSAASRARALAGDISGELLRWHPRTGWSKVAGSEASGPNGIEVSPDGEWVYVAEWGRSSFFRMSLTGAPRRETIRMKFRPDNVHWASDGMLLVGGATETESNVVKIDPRTLQVTELLERPDTKTFWHASAAVQVNNELWLGTARGDRIAIIPLAPRN
ncbi:MAG: hypothetical protein IT183_08520 [Acidobacteria bacterium]|nr:hypothetical protein [Acidobacteriota bacterium]